MTLYTTVFNNMKGRINYLIQLSTILNLNNLILKIVYKQGYTLF